MSTGRLSIFGLSIILVLLIQICCHSLAAFSLRPVDTPSFLRKRSCQFTEDGCKCIVRLRGECCCRGRGVEALPANLTTSIRVLIMYNTSIHTIPADFFAAYPNLEEIEFNSSPLLNYFDGTALKNLTNLRKFSLTWCKRLEEISGVLLLHNHKIQSLILKDNGLKRMPGLQMTDDHKLEVEIDLSGNEIQYIGDGRVSEVRARTLRLNHNRIREIAGYAFRGSSFVKLNLFHNPELTDLSTDSFKDLAELHHLDLSETAIRELPINGLKNLKSITLKNVPTLKKLPPVLSFTQLETAHFTYPHHCCLFKYVDDVVEGENGLYKNNMKEIHHRLCKQREERQSEDTARDETRRRRKRQSVTPSPTPDILSLFDPAWFLPDIPEDDDADLPEFPPDMIGASRCLSEQIDSSVRHFYHNITCSPQPDALNPCENIVGYTLLRRAIWCVWILAILGNILVWVTLLMAFEKRMKVHYLFMLNLSLADFITGVYLGMLAIEDVRTSDEYYRHAVSWQTGFGCQTAGFLAVFASKLSIISMFLIAFEMVYNSRMGFYGRRLSPRFAWCLLALGWSFSLLMASLPLVGVSSYSTTSICLPLKVESVWDRTYIIFGLMFNLISFGGMAVCYVFIILMLKDPSTPSRDEDKAIITKMALLIGTDLICWFPTLFFGLTAALGIPLISISNAKIFLVFFFPINSFANPFLYVFFTEVIQRKVRNKTLPVIRRITSSPGVALNTLSNFYHSQPPGKREEVNSPTRLQVTQMTSLNSTPRGSNCSTHRTIDSFDDIVTPRRNGSSPRVSFQDDCSSHRSSSESGRRSFGHLKRISAIPEVSDLSEHSSESHHEHIPKPRREERLQPSRFNWDRILGRNRKESSRSSGQDSGRGSINSDSTTRDTERASLISAGALEFDGDVTVTSSNGLLAPPTSSGNLLTPPIFSTGPPSSPPPVLPRIIEPSSSLRPPPSPPFSPPPRLRKLSPMPRRLVSRRQSAPLIRPRLTVTECSEGEQK